MSSPYMQRDDEIVMMRESGATLEEIGAAFGVTRERIRQLLQRQGYTKTRPTDVDPIAALRAARASGVTNLKQAASAIQMDYQAFYTVLGHLDVTAALSRLYRWRRESARRAHAITTLRSFAAKHGRAPTSAEIGFKAGIAPHPDLPRVAGDVQSFQSYRSMFAAAGLEARGKGVRGHLGPRLMPNHCARGHEYTPANTYVNRGNRYCITCKKLRRKPAKRRALRDDPGHVVTCDPAFHGGLVE